MFAKLKTALNRFKTYLGNRSGKKSDRPGSWTTTQTTATSFANYGDLSAFTSFPSNNVEAEHKTLSKEAQAEAIAKYQKLYGNVFPHVQVDHQGKPIVVPSDFSVAPRPHNEVFTPPFLPKGSLQNPVNLAGQLVHLQQQVWWLRLLLLGVTIAVLLSALLHVI